MNIIIRTYLFPLNRFCNIVTDLPSCMSESPNLDFLSLAKARLAEARVQIKIDPYDLKMLGKHPNGAVFVCNHLLPGADEWILLSILAERYTSIKLLHPYPVPPPKSLRPILLLPRDRRFGDPFQGLNFARRLARQVSTPSAVGLVIDFSDNLLGHNGKNLLRAQVLRQLRRSGQPIVPIHICVQRPSTSPWRRALPNWFGLPIPGEPVQVSVRVGSAITADDMALFQKLRPWSQFLQAKIFSLGSPFEVRAESYTNGDSVEREPIAEPLDPQLISNELESLPPKSKVASRSQFDVYIAPFSALPNVMLEIARLRELTFRENGEGTGKSRDLDEYDLYYLQLIIWDREKQKIAGGYRLGQGDQIFKRFGANGFYTTSLFRFNENFYPIFQQAVELGRSYIVPEYQRHRLSLFLLWKGILYFLLANPQYRYLTGPVSISKFYTEASKGVIVEFLTRYFFDQHLAQWVRPRKPFRLKSKHINARLLAQNLKGEFDALENFIETIEPGHFKVPVLFRQYLRQNARFVAFNVDPNFSDCLDGLMLLDLNNLPEGTVEALEK